MNWLQGIFDFLTRNVGNFLPGFWEFLRRVKWFQVTLAVLSVTALDWMIDLYVWAGSQAAVQALSVQNLISGWLGSGVAASGWSALSSGASLMNCVVPLDYVLVTGGAVLTVWLTVSGIHVLLAFWRRVPVIGG